MIKPPVPSLILWDCLQRHLSLLVCFVINVKLVDDRYNFQFTVSQTSFNYWISSPSPVKKET